MVVIFIIKKSARYTFPYYTYWFRSFWWNIVCAIWRGLLLAPLVMRKIYTFLPWMKLKWTITPLLKPFHFSYSEITPEGKRVTKLDQILLNGNNIAIVSISYSFWFELLLFICILFFTDILILFLAELEIYWVISNEPFFLTNAAGSWWVTWIWMIYYDMRLVLFIEISWWCARDI